MRLVIVALVFAWGACDRTPVAEPIVALPIVVAVTPPTVAPRLPVAVVATDEPEPEPEPEPDVDVDDIPDSVDRCPDEPEDGSGFEDVDGCPDAADRDNLPG